MFFIAFKGQVHMFAGQVKIVSHSSCKACATLKYFCPLLFSLCIRTGIHKMHVKIANREDPDLGLYVLKTTSVQTFRTFALLYAESRYYKWI